MRLTTKKNREQRSKWQRVREREWRQRTMPEVASDFGFYLMQEKMNDWMQHIHKTKKKSLSLSR